MQYGGRGGREEEEAEKLEAEERGLGAGEP